MAGGLRALGLIGWLFRSLSSSDVVSHLVGFGKGVGRGDPGLEPSSVVAGQRAGPWRGEWRRCRRELGPGTWMDHGHPRVPAFSFQASAARKWARRPGLRCIIGM